MNWTALSKSLFRLVCFLAAALILSALLRKDGFYDFTRQETEGFNTIVLLIGSIYSVMFAFVIFVIWGQFTDVENLVARESGALNDLLRFSRYMGPDDSHSIRRSINDYARNAANAEWQSLAKRQQDPQTERTFAAILNAVIRSKPADEPQQLVYGRLIDIARRAGEHRDERIAKSLTRVPPTLVQLVRTMAVALLLLVFSYPFHHWLTGAACFVLFAVVLFFANLVMTDTDNPFEGVCNISNEPFTELTQ